MAEEPCKGKTPKAKVQEGTKRQSCFCCGAMPPQLKSECPAKDVICYRCGRKGHYQSVAKAKLLNLEELWNTNRLKFIWPASEARD